MKKFILKLTLFLVVVMAISASIYVALAGNNKEAHPYDYKISLLDTVPSPRVILVGGSNIGKGIDSQIIKDSLDINVVNYAITALIGLKYMVDDIEQYVDSSDILVIAPEYSHFYGDLAYGRQPSLGLAISTHPEKWHLLNYKQVTVLFDGIDDWFRLESTLGKKADFDRASDMNRYGDFSGRWRTEGDTTKMSGKINKPLNEEFIAYFIDKLDVLNGKCKVIFTRPFNSKSYDDMYGEKIAEVSEYLEARGHGFAVEQDAHIFPTKYIYDSSYHPTYPGVVLNTQKLIREIREQLPR